MTVGAPGENSNAGVVHVLTIVSGPFGTGHQIWSQDSPNILDGSETGDQFGSSLVAGNFNGSGGGVLAPSSLAAGTFNSSQSDDLAIGVPGENARSGAVNVLFGGLASTNNEILMQEFEGMPETPEDYNRFGTL